MLDIDGWFFSILQRLIELLPSILDRMGVCIDYHDQRSFRFALSEAVCAYFLGKPVPHPTFGALCLWWEAQSLSHVPARVS